MFASAPDVTVLNPSIPEGKGEYYLFDFDGTVSTLRRGWEIVMKPVMLKAVFGEDPGDSTEKERVETDIEAFIEESTGIQTILQMTWLTEYVGKQGYTSPREPAEYKEIYSDELNVYIEKRKADAAAGNIEPYLIPGARDFLEKIRAKGKTLMLTSGTDRDFVMEEAALLKVDNLFNGGIFGSVDDVNRYSKKKVIEDLIQDKGIEGENLVITGDGPVEIRCAHEAGGIGIGVTCDEAELKGRDPKKIQRLTKAGADLLITDFIEKECIIEFTAKP